MRGWALALCGVAALSLAQGVLLLAEPVPRASDATAFSLVAIGALLLVTGLAFLRRRAWHVWFFAAWLGCSLAALMLAYKDTFLIELKIFGVWTLAGHIALHALIAPLMLLLGFVVGFAEPEAWKYVLVCVAVALLGGELLRRRLWPRHAGAPLSAGSTAGR